MWHECVYWKYFYIRNISYFFSLLFLALMSLVLWLLHVSNMQTLYRLRIHFFAMILSSFLLFSENKKYYDDEVMALWEWEWREEIKCNFLLANQNKNISRNPFFDFFAYVARKSFVQQICMTLIYDFIRLIFKMIFFHASFVIPFAVDIVNVVIKIMTMTKLLANVLFFLSHHSI
jgi:hypothetical protein